jgi:hypothetical protein
MPHLHLAYWRRLTDDTGMMQHAKFAVPDRSHGYTTDDNARALIAAVMWYQRDPSPAGLRLIYTYLAFVYHAQNGDGSFKNFMSYDRTFLESVGSEDSFGRALWAIGNTVAEQALPLTVRHTAAFMMSRAMPYTSRLTSPRAKGYALIGLSRAALSAGWPTSPGIVTQEALRTAIEVMAEALVTQYRAYCQPQWHWFEDSMTYGNAVLPWSLFQSAEVSPRSDWTAIARESLAFLTDLTVSTEGYFKPIGCQGWMVRGGSPALYDEQPIEAAEMLLTYQAAYRRFGDERDRIHMRRCYQWYLGDNSQHVPVLDPDTFGCYDGIEKDGLNLNQGAESLLSYLIAHLAMHDE